MSTIAPQQTADPDRHVAGGHRPLRARLRGAVLGVATFKGEVTDFDATLVDGSSPAPPGSRASRRRTRTSRPTCSPPSSSTPSATPSHLRRRARPWRRRVEIEGEITIKGITQPATLRGTLDRPATDHSATRATASARRRRRPHRVRHQLERRSRRHQALANEVTLKADLSLVAAA